MASAPDSRALQLQISASSELLIRNLKQADQAVAAFQQKTDERLSSVDQAFAHAGTGIKTAFAALAGAATLGTVIGLAKEGLEYASSLDEVSQQLGVTARDLQVYRYAASQVGISNEEMDAGLQKFTKSLGAARAGAASTKGVFHELGFTDDDIAHLDVHRALLKTADGIAAIQDRASRATPEVALFGKAGQQLDTLLSSGSGGINELAKAADDLGLVLSHDQIEHADEAADKISELKQVLEASIASAVADNAHAIFEFVEALEQLISKGLKAFQVMNSFKDAFQVAEGYLTAGVGMNIHGATLGYAGQGMIDRGYAEANGALARLRGDGAKPRAASGDQDARAGGKGYTDPAAAAAAARAAADAAKKAEEARKREAERQKRVADEGARLDDAFLSSRASITADVAEQARIERDKLERDTAAKLGDVDAQVQTKEVTAAEAAGLRARISRNAAIEADAINQRENIRLEDQRLQLADAQLSNLRDTLGSESSLANSARERREIAQRLLAAEKAAERSRLQAIADDDARPESGRHHTQGDIDVAKAGLGTLDQRYAGRAAVIDQQNAGPLDQYRDQLHAATDDMTEALEGVKVHGFQTLEDGLLGLINGTETAAGAFKKMAASIIADLARIAIEKAILGAVGGGGGGLGGLFSSIFGGGKATGGAIDASKFYVVGERGPELFAPGVSGSIIPNNKLAAPRLGNLGGGSGGAGRVEHSIKIEPSPMFEATVDSRVVSGVAQLSPMIVEGAKTATLQQAGRVGLPRSAG